MTTELEKQIAELKLKAQKDSDLYMDYRGAEIDIYLLIRALQDSLKIIESLQAENQELQSKLEEVKWQPIENAPKNGDLVKNRDLLEALDDLCKKHFVTWHWIKGHSGNRGNEIADGLAVRGKEEEKERIRQSLSIKING